MIGIQLIQKHINVQSNVYKIEIEYAIRHNIIKEKVNECPKGIGLGYSLEIFYGKRKKND